MPQVPPLTTRLRDINEDFMHAWHRATADQTVDLAEIVRLNRMLADQTRFIAQADDGVRLCLASLKGGRPYRVGQMQADFEDLHGPIDFQTYKSARSAGTEPDAS